jgi:hypothetical protein
MVTKSTANGNSAPQQNSLSSANKSITNPNNIIHKEEKTSSSANQSITSSNNTIHKEEKTSSPANQSIANTSNTIHKEEKTPLPVQSAFVKNDTRTGIRSSSSKTSSTAKISKEQQPLAVADTHIASHKTSKSNVVSSAVQTDKAEHTGMGNNVKPNEETVTASSPQLADNSNAKNTQSQNTPDKNQGNTSSNTSPTNNNNSPGDVANLNTAKSNKDISADTNTKPDANTSPSNNDILANNDYVSNTVSKSNNKKQPVKRDSSHTDIPPLLREPMPFKISEEHPSNILSIYAGGNYSLGWRTPAMVESTQEANGITPWGGFSFTHYFGEDLSLSLGVGYSEVINLKETYMSTIVQYDFGSTTNYTTVTPQTVYYMAFPLKLQYDIDARNAFGIGCDYLLMLTTYSTLSTYQQNSFTQTPVTSEKQNGYTQGFSNSDWQLVFSYTRMLTTRLGLSAEYYRDLDYIENSTIPNLTQSAKNSGFRLVVSYQILK